MATDEQLLYADHVGRFYVKRYGFPPVAARMLGYLGVCDPPEQTIADLAEALLASRSAITNAVKMLEAPPYGVIRRSRVAGERMDRVSLDPFGALQSGFDASEYVEQAALVREGLALLKDAPDERRAPLEEAAAMCDFLAKRMPELLREWQELRAKERGTRQ